MADLTQEEWVGQLEKDENKVILDVRTQEEIDEGYIPNSTHIDFYLGAEFVEALKKLDTTKNYYVYCRSGNRSGQACTIMNQLGIENAYNLMGGMNEWEGDVMG